MSVKEEEKLKESDDVETAQHGKLTKKGNFPMKSDVVNHVENYHEKPVTENLTMSRN